ncbi:DUF6351 family protein [Nocardioides iriomotensis]|uniref:DUF6351 domain-containing protein n=1 Tax=Nocardioides iriomotensis TaxID=715784 RepID=A0A4Q5J5Q8_9ACTN|nr:DUF6351 family protein [Nocardioides iriomotensis]RYU13079.1 hypothetical protein ETU37_09170 [Nocardioides iriomotensis]
MTLLLGTLVLVPPLPASGAASDGPPRFAGPRETPFFCESAEFRTADGSMLPPATGPECAVPTETDYVYRTTGGGWTPLPADKPRPADLAWTDVGGERVPFIVRVQTGTADRGIYEIAVLDDPSDGVEPDATTPSPGWNERLVYTFGGGCRGGWYRQGPGTGGVLVPSMLERGFAVASSSLNVFGHSCDDLLAAEVMAQTKHVFEQDFGAPRWTIGWGCSGGSYQGHQIADNYPGLLDGVIAGCSFPDVGFGTSQMLFDSRVLKNWFDAHPGSFTSAQQQAVAGFGVPNALASMSDGAKRLDPDAEFDGSVPPEVRYDAATNPTGARGTVWDHGRNTYGVDPATGFARIPSDNTGVQYGLQAWRDGAITADQFLDLNAGVGGLDVDANPTASRTTADPVARHNAYATGRMLYGGNGLGDVPLIDYRAYTDQQSGGDIHMRYQSFSTRARLVAANGDAGNQVMLTESDARGLFDSEAPVMTYALDAMDEWIANVRRDTRPGSAHARVARSRPAHLVDSCWTRDGERVRERQVYRGDTRCNRLYPSYASPRIVAGGPVASNVITCRTTAPTRSTYPTTTDAQWARLREVFAGGVCDYGRKGVDQAPPDGTWLEFTAPGVWTR